MILEEIEMLLLEKAPLFKVMGTSITNTLSGLAHQLKRTDLPDIELKKIQDQLDKIKKIEIEARGIKDDNILSGLYRKFKDIKNGTETIIDAVKPDPIISVARPVKASANASVKPDFRTSKINPKSDFRTSSSRTSKTNARPDPKPSTNARPDPNPSTNARPDPKPSTNARTSKLKRSAQIAGGIAGVGGAGYLYNKNKENVENGNTAKLIAGGAGTLAAGGLGYGAYKYKRNR